jgi:hypothetical protein
MAPFPLVVDLSTLTSADGFIIQGDAEGDAAGGSVLGDVNGDGIDDVIIGASSDDDGGTNAGEAYVVYGQVGLAGVRAAVGARCRDGAASCLNHDRTAAAAVAIAVTDDQELTSAGSIGAMAAPSPPVSLRKAMMSSTPSPERTLAEMTGRPCRALLASASMPSTSTPT